MGPIIRDDHTLALLGAASALTALLATELVPDIGPFARWEVPFVVAVGAATPFIPGAFVRVAERCLALLRGRHAE